MTTKEKILNKALDMFNAKGVEYVGIREIAMTLDLHVGNITYYFPTKDDLVDSLSLELNRRNSEIVVDDQNLTLESFVLNFQKVFSNHLKFRCLLLSFVHLMEQNKKIAARYKKTQKDRNATLRKNLQTLNSSGYLKITDENEIEFLVSNIAIIVRFWISEAVVSLKGHHPEKQLNYFVKMIARLLLPYASAKGTKQLNLIIESL